MAFMGEFQHNVDAKGRLFIPAKLREGLGERFIVTKGLENCLFVFPQKEWDALHERLRTLSLGNENARAFTRLFYSGAIEPEVDSQGRILLPANLRTYATLERDAVIVGVSSRVEIWAQSRWEEYSQKAEQALPEIAGLLNF